VTTPTAKKYETALSYAGEQRPYVERVAARLKAHGVQYFYDRDDPTMLWGLHLAEELPRIYEDDSATVVIFVSADHVAKDWTRLERRAALSRAAREKRTYVLVARFDDSELPGLIDDVVYVDLNSIEPEDFADQLMHWLTRLGVVVAKGTATEG
jgi:hypothetical protein